MPVRIIVSMDSHKSVDSDGIMYFGFPGKGEKTNPDKLTEWFNPDFLSLHKVYAIKEEEAFLLKIYTRTQEVANKVVRKRGGRKLMLLGEEVYGDVMIACGRCGYHSFEGSNVRRHIKKFVCAKERGYSRKELDGLNRIDRQKFIRRVASAKFRAKKKIEVYGSEETIEKSQECCGGTEIGHITVGQQNISYLDLDAGNEREVIHENEDKIGKHCSVKCTTSFSTSITNNEFEKKLQNKHSARRKPYVSRALTLGPLVEKDYVKKQPFDVYILGENNIRIAWKPSVCHKAAEGESCQIVFKGARMKRRCLDLPLPLILTYRKLDCKLHHCNFTLFHPHSRKAFKRDPEARTSVTVRMYGDTVMTQEFYHYFVSLLSVMKMKSSQTARHLTRVWETILLERLLTDSIPDEYRKIITLSKQTVKSLWSSIGEESGKNCSLHIPKASKRKKISTRDSSSMQLDATQQLIQERIPNEYTFLSKTNHSQINSEDYQHIQHSNQPNIHSQMSHEFNQQQECMKRFTHVLPKPAIISAPPVHSGPHSHPSVHSHAMLQSLSHPPTNPAHWLGQTHPPPHQYPPPTMAYSMPPPLAHEEYYAVQASFVTQYSAGNTVETSP